MKAIPTPTRVLQGLQAMSHNAQNHTKEHAHPRPRKKLGVGTYQETGGSPYILGIYIERPRPTQGVRSQREGTKPNSKPTLTNRKRHLRKRSDGHHAEDVLGKPGHSKQNKLLARERSATVALRRPSIQQNDNQANLVAPKRASAHNRKSEF